MSRVFWRYSFSCKASRSEKSTGLRSELPSSWFFLLRQTNPGVVHESTLMVNCYFRRSIISLHLCKEYRTAVKSDIAVSLLIKYWMFWCTDYTASTKSGTVQNRLNGRVMSTANHQSECKYGFTGLVQRTFNFDNIRNNSLTPDNVCFDSVGWVIWSVKTRPRYDL